MKKEKKKTLRNNKKPSKKTYLQKAGQISPSPSIPPINDEYEKEIIYTEYNKYLEDKNDLYDSILKEGDDIYVSQKSQKTETYLVNIKNIVDSITSLVSSIDTKVDELTKKISNASSSYGNQYTQRFFMVLHERDILIEKLKEQKMFLEKMFHSFKNNEIYIHLLDVYIHIINNSQKTQSYLETELNKTNDKIEKLIESIKEDYDTTEKQRKAESIQIENERVRLQDSIANIKRIPPPNFSPKPDSVYIPGCPYGTVLESDQCVYYDASKNVIEKVDVQKELVNSSSDFIVWFKDNNTSVEPIIFKKKPVAHIKQLNDSDQKVFNAKYVLCDENGNLKEDKYGSYTFISSKDCCWNDSIPELKKMDSPSNNFKEYYIDYDGAPQAIEYMKDGSGNILTNDTIRQVEEQELYVAVCIEEDQIVLGIQYIEVNKDGNIIYDDDKHCIPFFPDYLGFTKNKDVFTKDSYNGVDKIKYKVLKTFDTSINTMLDTTIITGKKLFNINDISTIRPTLINKTYLNSYVEFNLSKIYKPFILPFALQNEGDIILVHNSSDSIPIIFNISKDDTEKRVVVYPKQYYVFVFSTTSPLLHYGFIHLPIHSSFNTESRYAAILNGIYIFVNNDTTPILDSENLLIKVPNIDIKTKKPTYYNFDDVFLSNPLKITVLPNPVVYNKPIFSLQKNQYRSENVCKINNMYVFCDNKSEPNLDIFSYPVPVPYTLEESGGKYLWDTNIVNVLKPYDGILTLDPSYKINNKSQSGGDASIDQNTLTKYLDILNPKLQTIQTFIDKYGNTNPELNNFAELYLQLNTIVQGLPKEQNSIDLEKQFNEGNEIFKKAMETQSKMNSLEKQKSDNDTLQKTLASLKLVYSTNLAELLQYETNIQTKYNNLNDEITHLDENINSTTLKSDLNEIHKMFEASKNARVLLVDPNSTDTVNPDQIKGEESKIEILIQTNKSIESIEDALEISIQKEKSKYDATLLNTDKKLKDDIRSEIMAKSAELDTLIGRKDNVINSQKTSILNNQQSETFNDYKKQIDLSITNIQNLIENARKTPNIIQTKEDIKKQLDTFKLNFTSIQNEKKTISTNINKIENLFSELYSNNLISKKNIIDDKIKKILFSKKQIEEILNRLNRTTPDETIEQELNMILTEANTIQTTIEPILDPDDLEGHEERIDDLIKQENDILTSLQMKLSSSLEPSSSPPTPSLAPYVGGRSKRFTRKFPKNLIISH